MEIKHPQRAKNTEQRYCPSTKHKIKTEAARVSSDTNSRSAVKLQALKIDATFFHVPCVEGSLTCCRKVWVTRKG